MEPLAKRMRMSAPEENATNRAKRNQLKQPNYRQNVRKEPEREMPAVPSRTIDLAEFRPRYVALNKRDNSTSTSDSTLIPRTPDATVTATVLNVAVMESGSITQTTQVSAASSDSIVSMGSMGPLTIPGIDATTATVGTTNSEAIKSTSTVSSTITTESALSALPILSSLLASNNTSSVTSSERTITVTATSSLAVTYTNGTFLAPSRSTGSYTLATLKNNVTTTRDASQRESTSGSSVDFASTSSDASQSDLPTSTITTAPAYTNHPGNGIAGAATSSASSTSSSDTPNSGGNNGINLTPQQQQLVGGAVGGIAGVALVLVALLYFLKWYRRRLKALGRLPEQDQHHDDFGEDEDQALTRRTPMVESDRSSVAPILSFASRLKELRPHSSTTMASNTTRTISFPPSEADKGFQKISGRKIPSVLSTGGDGYGDDFQTSKNSHPSAFARSHQRTSWFRDSSSHETSEAILAQRPSSVSEPTTPVMNPFRDPPTQNGPYHGISPALNISTHDLASSIQANQIRSQFGLNIGTTLRGAEGFAALRPSPARTAITQSPTSSHFRLPEPISTPPLLNGDVPDLPPVPKLEFPPWSKEKQGGIAHNHPSSTDAPRSISRLSVGGLSARSASGFSARSVSTGGRFKEDI